MIPSLEIADFCETGSGGTPSRANLDRYYTNGTIPWVKSGELRDRTVCHAEEAITDIAVKESSAKLLEPGAVLIAMYGATVGEVAELKIRAATNQAVCHLYPDPDRCVPEYLYHQLLAAKPVLLSQRVGGGQPNISQSIIKKLKIPLPPLPEQKRIASILDAADALRAKRRESIAQLDTLLQSTFLDMFGDPVTNPMGWKTGTLETMALKFTDGPFGSNLKSSHYVEEGVRVLRLQNIGVGKLLDDDCAFITKEHFNSLERNHCIPNDVIIATLGDPNLRACVIPENLENSLNKADCLMLRPNMALAKSVYIAGLINCESTVKKALELVRGQTRGRISLGRLRELELPIPEVANQDIYIEAAAKIDRQKSIQQSHLNELNTLFASLQQSAFNGQL